MHTESQVGMQLWVDSQVGMRAFPNAGNVTRHASKINAPLLPLKWTKLHIMNLLQYLQMSHAVIILSGCAIHVDGHL